MAFTKEQEEAIYKSESNIIVSAGAGSGKTAVLSTRVLEKINSGIHVNELLILTFTVAGASEMKDRIRKNIVSNPNLKDELNLLDSAYITTFDSFALSIVKKYSYLLNISKNISITSDSIIKIQKIKIMDEVFESLYENPSNEFSSFVKRFCVKNDTELKKNILNLANKIEGYIDPNEYIENIKNNFFTDENIDNIIYEYKKFISNKQTNIKKMLDEAYNYIDTDFVNSMIEKTSGILSCDIDHLSEYEKVNLGTLRNASEEAKSYKKKIVESLKELTSYAKYGTYTDIKYDIVSSKGEVLVIIDIISKYFDKLKKYKEENEMYTFSDIAALATKIVRENKAVRDTLKYSFKEIMIDEYQDTNDIQDSFVKLIENNNVYMVGDIKQSIYRFRGANPLIFKEKYDNYSKNNGGIKIDLLKNFRSRSEVLVNINDIFCLLMDNEIGGAEYSLSHQMAYGNTDYDSKKFDIEYNMDILEYDEVNNYSQDEIEAFIVAKDIKDKLASNLEVYDKEKKIMRKANYSDFVIILDRYKPFDNYKKIFEYLGIPVTLQKKEELGSNTDISLIRNIIDFIIRINDKDYGIDFKYDFMSIARSFLYEYDDQYIFDCFEGNGFINTKIYEDFSKIESISSKTCDELFEEILDITDFYNKIYKNGDYKNTNVRLKNIYDISASLNNFGYTISDFRDYLDDVVENGIKIEYQGHVDSTNSVKILTIHASKGLEYPICYFPSLDNDFNERDLSSKYICDKKYGLIVPSSLEDTNDSVLKILYKNEQLIEDIAEKIRLFYVALTRAREKIIILLPYKDTSKLSREDNGVISSFNRGEIRKLSTMLYDIKDYLKSDYFKKVDIDNIGLTKNYLYKKDIKNKINSSNDILKVEEINIENNITKDEHFSKESNVILSKETIENMKYGTMIHEIFELIDFKNYDPNLISDKHIRDKVSKFLNNELMSDIKNANIYHEYEFEYEDNNINYHGIIDLMIEYDDYINIIDFKLKNISDEHYKEQLNGYKKCIERISNKKVNTYLYSILDEEFTKIL